MALKNRKGPATAHRTHRRQFRQSQQKFLEIKEGETSTAAEKVNTGVELGSQLGNEI